MGNSPGTSSEDSYGNTRMEPSDFQMVNFNLTTSEEKAMGERMTLSASGREKMGMSDQAVMMTAEAVINRMVATLKASTLLKVEY